MKFDVIICTYNRPVILINLVKQLIKLNPLPEKILIIDSSDIENAEIREIELVHYIRSSHKNQPYQRYVGFLASSADILMYLDDDIELINDQVFKDTLDSYSDERIDGVSGRVDYKAIITKELNTSIDINSLIFKISNFISGVPQVQPGRISYVGITGGSLLEDGRVDFFNGPFMTFRRSSLSDKIFDPILFTNYEYKIGKGEDKVLSMRLGLKGNLLFIAKTYFKHPPVESHYFNDVESFILKISYSRLYLSIVYGKNCGKHTYIIYLHYLYFMVWRIFIALVQYLIRRSVNNKAVLSGQIRGLLKAIKLSPNADASIDWKKDAKQNISSSK